MPIARAHERLIVARLLMALTKASCHHFWPQMPLPEARDYYLIGLGVALGHMNGKPHTLSSLARLIEMPLGTLARKIPVLLERGYIRRRGRHFCLNEDELDKPEHLKLLDTNASLIVNAAKLLSKMERS